MPCKNEIDLLPITLKVISQYCDYIIISDQMSDDGSREVYKQFPKVKVIDNNRIGHSNQVRWDLLAEARKIEGSNLIISLDADEFIPPSVFKKFIESETFEPGKGFKFPWIQLWRSIYKYNDAGVWKNNFKPIAWVDDRLNEYSKKFIINDHTSRIPDAYLKRCKTVKDVPIIHLQWVYWNKTQIKQAWYLCSELIKNPDNYSKINETYSTVKECAGLKLKEAPKEWLLNSGISENLEKLPPSWQLGAIIDFFDKHGIEFFEPLQIWHIKELEDEFIKRVGRKPKSETTSPLVALKRKIKQLIINSLKNIKYGF